MVSKLLIVLEIITGLTFIIAAMFYSQLTGLAIDATPAQNEHYGSLIFAGALILLAFFIGLKFIYKKSMN